MDLDAVAHAKNASVRTLAGAMFSAQSAVIIQMEQTLRTLGASSLPPPPSH